MLKRIADSYGVCWNDSGARYVFFYPEWWSQDPNRPEGYTQTLPYPIPGRIIFDLDRGVWL